MTASPLSQEAIDRAQTRLALENTAAAIEMLTRMVRRTESKVIRMEAELKGDREAKQSSHANSSELGIRNHASDSSKHGTHPESIQTPCQPKAQSEQSANH